MPWILRLTHFSENLFITFSWDAQFHTVTNSRVQYLTPLFLEIKNYFLSKIPVRRISHSDKQSCTILHKFSCLKMHSFWQSCTIWRNVPLIGNVLHEIRFHQGKMLMLYWMTPIGDEKKHGKKFVTPNRSCSSTFFTSCSTQLQKLDCISYWVL